MSIQVSNILNTNPGVFKLAEGPASEKPMPALNTLVSINILEKVEAGYKILVDGRLYFSDLPLQPDMNETLIAKVISQSPFILSLDNIASSQTMDGTISFLLMKLQIPASKLTERIIKAFLWNKKPVIKSKIEKIAELIEAANLELDDEHLNEAISILGSDEKGSSSITPSVIQMFRKNESEIALNIKKCIMELAALEPSHEKIKEIYDLFVIDEEQINPVAVRNCLNNRKGQLDFILNAECGNLSGKAAEAFHNLKYYLLVYNLRKGLTPSSYSFIIIKSGSDFDLIELNSEYQNKSFSFKVEMSPNNLGVINTQGNFKESHLSLLLKSDSEISVYLQKYGNELENRLKQCVRYLQSLKFCTLNRSGVKKVSTNCGKINVRY